MRIRLLFGFLAAVAASGQDRAQEGALGARLADEIRQRPQPLDSSVVTAYAEGICRKLAAKLPDPGIPDSLESISGGGYWTLSQEPLVLPGGRIFVRAGQILTAQSEAEFAGVLAHALAHVAGRQFTQWKPGQTMWSAGARDRGRFEFEADPLAIQMTRDAGYDPAGLVRYLDRPPSKPGTDSSLFTPPPRAARVAAMESAIRGLPERTFEAPDPEEFARVQAEVRGVAPVDEPLFRGPFMGSGTLRKHE